MNKLRVTLLLASLLAGANALVNAIHVSPIKASWSGLTHRLAPNNYVSQLVTANFDYLDSLSGGYVELFAGSKGAGGTYHLSVRTYPGDVEIATDSQGRYPLYVSWIDA